MRHLLVTNDFPPKIGGIQSYLWELWRRLPPGDVTVLTTPHPGAAAFDRDQGFRVVRSRQPVLLPHPLLASQIRRLAAEVGAEAVMVDPAVPLGALAPGLGLPYGVVLHGSEVTVPGRLPPTRPVLARVLRHASLVVAGGGYPKAEAERVVGPGRLPPVVQVPPGVDTGRFVPLDADQRRAVRVRLGLDPDAPTVLSVSRLVPRKGMDTLIDAAAMLAPGWPDLQVVISGTGRDRDRLARRITRTGAPVRLLGRVDDADLPGLYAQADVFVLDCRVRWGGLEQEGFGIVFLEAAASGVPAVAGRSGGADEAVADGVTGRVLDDPTDAAALAAAIGRYLADPAQRDAHGRAARRRAESDFAYDVLAATLRQALDTATWERPRMRPSAAD